LGPAPTSWTQGIAGKSASSMQGSSFSSSGVSKRPYPYLPDVSSCWPWPLSVGRAAAKKGQDRKTQTTRYVKLAMPSGAGPPGAAVDRLPWGSRMGWFGSPWARLELAAVGDPSWRSGEVEGSYGERGGVFLFLEKTWGVFLFPSFLTVGGRLRGRFFPCVEGGRDRTYKPTYQPTITSR
jgi:hypothetical protein